MCTKILFLGDAFFKSPNGEDPFKSLSAPLTHSVTVVNCETVITNRIPLKYSKDNKLISLSTTCNNTTTNCISSVDIVSLANNHTLDFGEEELQTTIGFFESHGKSVIGLPSRNHTSIHINEKKIIVIGCANFPGKKYSNYLRMSDALKVIENHRNSDYTVVFIHWGEEYADFPSPRQRKIARKMISKGADLIIGHHPHVFQGKENINGKLVYYSIGNANFGTWQNKYSKWSTVSLVVELDCSKENLVCREYFFKIKDDYSLTELTFKQGTQAKERLQELSGKNMDMNWIQWGMKTSETFLVQEKEAFCIRFQRKQFKQYLIFLYWLSRPKTLFLLFCFILKRMLGLNKL